MTLKVAAYEKEIYTEDSPTWVDFAKLSIHAHLADKGVPIGDPEIDDNLLFIGETSPHIQAMAAKKKRYSILLFLPNPFHVLSQMAILGAEAIYAINSTHLFMIKNTLRDRFGGKQPD